LWIIGPVTVVGIGADHFRVSATLGELIGPPFRDIFYPVKNVAGKVGLPAHKGVILMTQEKVFCPVGPPCLYPVTVPYNVNFPSVQQGYPRGKLLIHAVCRLHEPKVPLHEKKIIELCCGGELNHTRSDTQVSLIPQDPEKPGVLFEVGLHHRLCCGIPTVDEHQEFLEDGEKP